MNPFARRLALLVAVASQVGCTRVVVHKDPGVHDKGIRYYRPKPYLFITPASGGGGKAPTGTFTVDQAIPVKQVAAGAGDGGQVTPAQHLLPAPAQSAQPADGKKPAPEAQANDGTAPTPDLTKISMSMLYLPDFAEEYSIQLRPGLGIGELSLQLENGWNLTSVGIKTDQQTDEIIKSVADLVSSVGPLTKERSREQNMFSTNIPFGFYEAVISTDPAGRKRLYGFRYVGFMPFQGCPVDASGHEAVCCNDGVIYGMVYEQGVLVFKPINQIPALGQNR